ncbi:purine-cytosine permease family protein [Aneurinibacillus terranovensis]|uniref:purine-cytosine permease family protein n=1 Tax=Aneurinibacillus terranovensis TaxID=278991 RepID=UPI00041BBBA7|nr:cytosine permease [Aneurinibacillus terranovensis]
MANEFGHDSVRPVPKSERSMKFFSTFSLWVGANVVVTTVFTGMMLVPDLKFTTAMWIVLIGSLIGGIPLLLSGNIGTRTGLPTMILTRGAFGHRGAALPSAVNTIVLIGWSWVQAYMAGLSLDHAVQFVTGYSNIDLFVIVTEVFVVLITIYGHRAIEKAENIVASLMLILSVVVFGYMFTHFHVSKLLTMQTSAHPAVTTMVAFDIVIATAFSWMSSSADYNRNCASERTGMWGTLVGYTVATVVAMGLGATVSGFSLLGHMTQTYDPTELIGSINPMLGFVAGIVIFLSVLSTNVMALYSASMSYLAIFPKSKYFLPTLIMGILCTAGALLKDWLLNHFQNFLLMVGTLFIPVVAVLLVDYYLLKKSTYDAEEIISGEKKVYWYSGGINYMAYVAYIIGAVFAYYFTYVHPLVTGATILTFLLTSVLYIVLMKISGVSIYVDKADAVAEQE